MDGWETARRIRRQEAQAGIATPTVIIMVSANAFENQPDKLAEAGAQAFVDKPVIESELLVALQRHLQLEWVAELQLPGWVSPAQPRQTAGEPALPAEYTTALTRLARLGHAKGLHQALDRLATEQPAQRAQADALRGLVERFAFDSLLDHLQSLQAVDAVDAVDAVERA
jgi:hypothetical protein